MKVSYNWLTDFVDISETPQELGSRLTNLGFAMDDLVSHQDSIFELDIGTNRPDCLCHVGLAREIAAAYGRPTKLPALALEETPRRAADIFSISIADTDLCSRYCGRYIAE